MHPFILFVKLPNLRCGIVLGTIIDINNFQIQFFLLQKSGIFHHFLIKNRNVFLFIIARYDYAQ